MNQQKIFDQLISKYSFNFIVWGFWLILVLCLLIYCFINFALIHILGLYVFFAFIYAFFIFLPSALLIYAYIFCYLYKRENINLSFRIKTHFILHNILYKIFILFSFIFVIMPTALISSFWLVYDIKNTDFLYYFNFCSIPSIVITIILIKKYIPKLLNQFFNF